MAASSAVRRGGREGAISQEELPDCVQVALFSGEEYGEESGCFLQQHGQNAVK